MPAKGIYYIFLALLLYNSGTRCADNTYYLSGQFCTDSPETPYTADGWVVGLKRVEDLRTLRSGAGSRHLLRTPYSSPQAGFDGLN